MTNWLFRTMIVPDSIVTQVRSLADSFGPVAQGMWITPLSPTGTMPATHWISSGLIGDDFAAIMPFSHYDDSEPPVWMTDDYDPAAFVALASANGVIAPPVEVITQIMSMVDVSDKEPFTAIARMNLQMIQESIED
ncbi:MAG: hypothetical protein ABFD50_07185 [Smithella sp.]